MRKSIVLLAQRLVLNGSALPDHHKAAPLRVAIDTISGIGLFENTGAAAIPAGGEGGATAPTRLAWRS